MGCSGSNTIVKVRNMATKASQTEFETVPTEQINLRQSQLPSIIVNGKIKAMNKSTIMLKSKRTKLHSSIVRGTKGSQSPGSNMFFSNSQNDGVQKQWIRSPFRTNTLYSNQMPSDPINNSKYRSSDLIKHQLSRINENPKDRISPQAYIGKVINRGEGQHSDPPAARIYTAQLSDKVQELIKKKSFFRDDSKLNVKKRTEAGLRSGSQFLLRSMTFMSPRHHPKPKSILVQACKPSEPTAFEEEHFSDCLEQLETSKVVELSD